MHFHKISAAALLLVGLAGAVGLTGCDDSDDEQAAKVKEAPKKTAQSPADKPEADAKDSYDRLVFGLPMPPNVLGLTENEREVRIKVRMTLKEVGAFFEQNLVDYEILYPRDQVRAVGLRSYMPEAYAYPYGPFSFVVYSRGKTNPAANKDKSDKADEPKNRVIVAGRDLAGSSRQYKKGDPILERTEDGELLAPGARWGEAYTPPPGSPLDKLHFRSNFGRPYGQWVAR